MPVNTQLVSLYSAKYQTANRTAHISHQVKSIQKTLQKKLSELSATLGLTFSFDKISLNDFHRYLVPTAMTAAGIMAIEVSGKALQPDYMSAQSITFVRLAMSLGVLLNSARYHITENELKTTFKKSLNIASEMLAIVYLYQSSFNTSRLIFSTILTNRYSLLNSLLSSAIMLPGAIAYTIEAYQKKYLKDQYAQGAQRSDTAMISSGLSKISNAYFQINRLLIDEFFSLARMFQLGLIANNILNDKGITRQLRNVPAMLIDMIPPTLRKYLAQLKKQTFDLEKNTAKHLVLKNGVLVEQKRHTLRKGDFVWCGQGFVPNNAPISGEIVALDLDGVKDNQFILTPLEFTVNLKCYTGENTWLKFTTPDALAPTVPLIDAYAIQEGKQLGILDGAQIDFLGHQDSFFVRVSGKKELMIDTSYEKKSVINSVIRESKQRNIRLAVALAVTTALVLKQDLTLVPAEAAKLLFSVFQMMIPFSEAFLREMVNSKFLKALNARLGHWPLEIIDSLKVVDLYHALSGYHTKEFPQGVAIISDKTGTLTTLKMEVQGVWQQPEQSTLSSSEIFELFACAYTNNKPEIEPEEHAILKRFSQELKDIHCLQVEVKGINHFEKTIRCKGEVCVAETFHLGLYKNLGGRLTVSQQSENYKLIFVGIPKPDAFNRSRLLASYGQMQVREGVLSRDWCIASSVLSANDFTKIKALLIAENFAEIEKLVLDNYLLSLQHHATFLIDNPVKVEVEHFISHCKTINVPVFVATGDTEKAAFNIAKVLNPKSVAHIRVIRAKQDIDPTILENNLSEDTLIFVGVNEKILAVLDDINALPMVQRPGIIFAEMSTEGKGVLARHLKKTGFFVVANGDGTNDIAMMQAAHLVIAHLNGFQNYAPGVAQYANLNEYQVQRLCDSTASFYQLFDIQKQDSSQFIQHFIRLANAQEMVSYALSFKAIKVCFDLATAMGVTGVTEVWQQQWVSIAFDLCWLWLAFKGVDANAHVPTDNKNLNESWLPLQCMCLTLGLAVLETITCVTLTGRSTDISLLVLMLALLPTFLTSFFSGFKNYAEVPESAVTLPVHTQVIAKPEPYVRIGGLFSGSNAKIVQKITEIKVPVIASRSAVTI